MSSSASRSVDATESDEIPRIVSDPPPPGESIHESETKVGAAAYKMVLEEVKLAAAATRPEQHSTTRAKAFDLAAALYESRVGDATPTETSYARAPFEAIEVVHVEKLARAPDVSIVAPEEIEDPKPVHAPRELVPFILDLAFFALAAAIVTLMSLR